MAELKESYYTGDDSQWGTPIYEVYNEIPGHICESLVQTFTTESSYILAKVRLKLWKSGSPGTLTIGIYRTDGSGYPTGSALCSVTTNGNTLGSSPGVYRELTFSAGATLSSGTKYAIMLTAPDGVVDNDYVMWRCDITSSAYSGGEGLVSAYWEDEFQGWKTTISGEVFDFMFIIYGDDVVPSKPTNPTPTNDGTEVDFSAFGLSWDDGGGADTYDVYIGETGNLTSVSSEQAGTSYTTSLEELESIYDSSPINQKIYWRVDATNIYGTTTGDEWNFDARPAKASNPTPADEYTDMTLDWMVFGWDEAITADTYDVYVGTETGGTPWSENMELIVDSGELWGMAQSYLLVAMNVIYPYTGAGVHNYLYYWQVNTKNQFGTTEGDYWSFTTISYDPPLPTGITLDYSGDQSDEDYGEQTGTPTGVNNMITIRGLVAAANDKIWYEDL